MIRIEQLDKHAIPDEFGIRALWLHPDSDKLLKDTLYRVCGKTYDKSAPHEGTAWVTLFVIVGNRLMPDCVQALSATFPDRLWVAEPKIEELDWLSFFVSGGYDDGFAQPIE